MHPEHIECIHGSFEVLTIMALTAASLRNKYLQDASHSLLASSPSVSAHLQSSRLRLTEESRETGERRKGRIAPVCEACGNILIIGWSCKRQYRDSGRRTSREPRKCRGREVHSQKVSCDLCRAVTTLSVQKLPNVTEKRIETYSRPNSKQPAYEPTPPGPTDSSQDPALPQTKNPTAVSHPSASRKARSKKSSLQALLGNQSRPTASSNAKPGLDLMDFMKT